MNANWKDLMREAGLEVDGDSIRVSCGVDRCHKVLVDDTHAATFRLWSVVATRGDAPADAALQAWRMNRFRELVGFKVAEYGRVIGECFVPRIALTPDEWRLYALTLARACDRLEHLWTGRDVE